MLPYNSDETVHYCYSADEFGGYWSYSGEEGYPAVDSVCEFEFNYDGNSLYYLREVITGVSLEAGNYTGPELNQALSFGVDDDGGLYPISDFVAGKTTAVIARYNGYVENPSEYTLDVVRGDVLATLTGKRSDDGTGIIFTVSADLLELPAEYSFRHNGANGGDEISGYFAETRTLRLLLVPIRGCFGGDVTEPADGWQENYRHLSACYPIAEKNITVDLGELVDLSGSEYDLYTENGKFAVWDALTQLQNYDENGYDLILGFVAGWMGESQNIGGFTCGLPANVINAELPCAAAVVSHEVAHCFIVGDEYENGAFNLDVNDAPYGYSGQFWYQRDEIITAENPNVIAASQYDLICSGSAVLANQRPFDVVNGRELGNVASIMCGCDDINEHYWISSDIWEQLYTALTIRNYTVETGSHGGIISTEDGSLKLFCENCHHTSELSDIIY